MTPGLIALRQRLAEALRGPLPGHAAFLAHAGYSRSELQRIFDSTDRPRESAVLALIYDRDDGPHILLMLRTDEGGVHAGQVSFPGGRKESDDPDLRATALREFREEIGAPTDGIEVLGTLSQVFIPPSRSLITPFVAVRSTLGPTSPQASEVRALIEAPLSKLLAPDALRMGERYVQALDRRTQVPGFEVQGHLVWGATAMMIAELRELLHVRT
ncbi:MAG: CoA pyrophosphatase [Flavobacteriales bacterium]|nr:CoA pyrophosphatase [Flavobacteriales bacterium]